MPLITTSWLKTFERNYFCELLDIPPQAARYLMDVHVKRRKVVLLLSRVSKDPGGCGEITEDWTLTFKKKDFARKLGIDPGLVRRITTIFVIMGEVQVRFHLKER